MNIHHIPLFCFLSALCGTDTGLVSARMSIYTGVEGGNGTISCHLSSTGNNKFFCKNKCEAENILIKTEDVRAQNGRFIAEYKGRSSSGRGIVSVTITHMTKSDAGVYRCGLGGDLVPENSSGFEVRVSDAATVGITSGYVNTYNEGEDFSFGCMDTVYKTQMFLCVDPCNKKEDIIIETQSKSAQNGRYSIEYKEGSVFGLYVEITNVSKSDSGTYKCGYGSALSPDTSYTTTLHVDEAPTPSSKPKLMPQRLTTSVPSDTTPATTQTPESFIFLLAFPTSTNQPAAADPTTSKPELIPQPFSTSVPKTSTPAATQALSYSSGHLYKTTNQPPAAAPTFTSKPKSTPQRSTTSVPSASTPAATQSLRSTSGGVPSLFPFPKSTNQPVKNETDYFLPLVVCVAGVLLLVVFLLILCEWKTRRNIKSNSGDMELPVIYANMAAASACEDSNYKTSSD